MPELNKTPLLLPALVPFGYNNRPEQWQADNLKHFSAQKSLYDYQMDALKNAIVALWAYYGKDDICAYRPGEPAQAENNRRRNFAALMNKRADEKTAAPKDVFYKDGDKAFDVLIQRLSPVQPTADNNFQPRHVPFARLANRMGFWMATGSGKTLVMLKLIENLRRLTDAGLIPARKILILAPSELLLRQIRQTAMEYNRDNARPLDIINLRDWRTTLSGRDAIFCHRADLFADERKKTLIDWREFENNGEWYVLLDEAHRGQAEDSKRQAYYSLLSRAGFLFNFSATFTDREDIMTTAAKFNLANFATESYGKHINLCGAEFRNFNSGRKDKDYDDDEKKRIVLQSVMALALVKKSIAKLRAAAEEENIPPPYHNPLMVTLTNSVNTPESDLRAFFNVIAGLAKPGGLDAKLFSQARKELADDLRQGEFLFENKSLPTAFADAAAKLTMADARRAVFLTDNPGALEIITGEVGKELAIKLRTAAEPFGLIRIGETRKWQQYAENAGMFITKDISDKPFFSRLETSGISVLMGSRAFFESWDSVRPNVINFINIGKGKAAVKFIVQSIGRGVRIRPMPPPKEYRRRIATLEDKLSDAERRVYLASDKSNDSAAAESLFVFAAKRDAIKKALEGLESEGGEQWHNIGGLFERNKRPVVGGEPMALLAPDYRESKPPPSAKWQPMPVSRESLTQVRAFVGRLSDGMLAVACGKSAGEISTFRGVIDNDANYDFVGGNDIPATPSGMIKLAFSHPRIRGVKTEADIRPLREKGEKTDIVHFRLIATSHPKAQMLKQWLRMEKNAREKLEDDFADRIISREEFRERTGELVNMEKTFEVLKSRRLAEHYYTPLVAASDAEKAAYIRHIVKTKSEADFLVKLESALPDCGQQWDGWMFSKLDENTDKIYIPYRENGNARRFYPDFVFWMCRGNDYRIVFVDPTGTEHVHAERRLDGYTSLFEKGKTRRQFKHGRWNVTVGLWLFNNPDKATGQYRRFWTKDPAAIFQP